MKLFKKVEPIIVVAITKTRAIVTMNFLCTESICRQSAKAMTPLTIPLYQHTFNSLELNGNGLFISL